MDAKGITMFIKCVKSDSDNFDVDRDYEIKSTKKIRHSDNYKAVITDNFGAVEVHSNLKDEFGVDGVEFDSRPLAGL